MNLNVAMLQAMQDEGLDLAACIRVLQASEDAEPKQSSAAARQARYRARRRNERNVTRDVTAPPKEEIISNPQEAKASINDKHHALNEKREAIGSCLRQAFPPPDGVSAEQWSAFRKQRKKALNERSYALVIGKLGELAKAGHAPGAMIDLAIERGWETVFEPRQFMDGKQVAPAKPKITDSRVIAANKRATAAIYEKMGRSDEAAQLRREAAQLDQQQAA